MDATDPIFWPGVIPMVATAIAIYLASHLMILGEARAINQGEETQITDRSTRVASGNQFIINLSTSDHGSDDRLARDTSDVTIVRTSTQGS